MTQAAAAFLIAAQELVGDGKALLPAVALTQPLCSALFVPMGTWLQTYQASKSLPSQILLTGLHLCLTATIPDRTSLEGSGVQHDRPTAVAVAIPDGVAVFPLIGRRCHCQFANTKTGFNDWPLSFLHEPLTTIPSSLAFFLCGV